MKIAVYGDSYGGCNLENIPGDSIDRGPSWVELLAEKHEVVNFSEPGASLIYSYNIFLANHSKFDHNIFLITEPGRITLPAHSSMGYLLKHINFSLIESFKKNKDRSNLRINKTLSAIEDYYTFIHDDTNSLIMHNLIVDNIPRIDKNTILIPCFPRSMNNGGISLNEITRKQYDGSDFLGIICKVYGIDPIITDENGTWTYKDYQKCHLSEENNRILFDYMDNAIINKQNKLDFKLDDFQVLSKEFEFYFYLIKFVNDTTTLECRLNGEIINVYNKLTLASK